MGAPRIDRLDKNYLINGNVDFWQRGTSSGVITDATKRYLADRFYHFVNNNTPTPNATLSRSTDVPADHNAIYSAKWQRNAGNTNTSAMIFGQAVESNFCRKLRNKYVTMIFYAKAGANYSATGSALEVLCHTGTGTDQDPGNAYTGQQTVFSQAVTLTTSWQKFLVQSSAPLATNINEMRAFIRGTPTGTAGADDSFYVTGLCLVEGLHDDLEFCGAGRDHAEEFALCQRYYETVGPGGTGSGTTTAASQLMAWRFLEAKRAVPVITHLANYTCIISGQSTYTATSTTPSFVSTTGFSATANFSPAPGVTGTAIVYHTSTENIAADAEM